MKIQRYTRTGRWGKEICDAPAEVMSGSPLKNPSANEPANRFGNRIEQITMRTEDGFIVTITRDELNSALEFCERSDVNYSEPEWWNKATHSKKG